MTQHPSPELTLITSSDAVTDTTRPARAILRESTALNDERMGKNIPRLTVVRDPSPSPTPQPVPQPPAPPDDPPVPRASRDRGPSGQGYEPPPAA